MKKQYLLAAVLAVLIILTGTSCSKRRNVHPVGPGDIYTATCTPAISTATYTVTRTNTPLPPTGTRTNTPVPPTSTFTRTATATAIIPSATLTPSYTETIIVPSATDTPVYSPTNTPSVTPTLTDTPVYSPTITPTATMTFTDTPVVSHTSTRTATFTATVTITHSATPTHTPTPVATPTFTATTPSAAVIIYDGDTAGTRLADGAVTNDGAGTMTETAGGNPGNMMRLTYVNAAWWQQHEWNKTDNVDIGANTYLVFDVKLDAASANPEKQLKVRIDWGTGLDVFVANFLVEGGIITTAWKTVKIAIADIKGAAQTQIDFIAFIGNTDINYTVDIDNIRLEGSVPSPSPTFTITTNPAWSPTVSPTITPTSAWNHPGAWSSAAELAFVKGRIAANAQPWTQELSNLTGQTGGAASGVNFNGVVQNSCTQEGSVQTDSALVYANALAWYLTGTQSYYTKAMTILNNYASSPASCIQGFQSTGCFAGQSILNASWFGVLFANACELLRTSPSWTANDTARFVNMFKTGFYPKLNTMSPDNGNIDLTQIDAMFSMAVFCEDQAEWDLAVSRYKARMPAAFIDSTWTGVPGVGKPASLGNVNTNNCGGASSPPVDFWYCPTSWAAGLQQETCRDLGHHTQFALDAAVDCAEIDYHQGSPDALYASYQTMLVPALELLARQFVTATTCGVCSGTWPAGQQKLIMFEEGYNHYANRMGLGASLTNTGAWITTSRANGGATRLQFNIAFETLTHAGVN